MRLEVPEAIPAAGDLGRVHFVGIGGAGLSAIARIMARRGVPVTGSDDQDTPFLVPLRELGVECRLGYAAEHVGAAETLVVTTAAREDNPEVAEARERGLLLLPRSAGLAAVMHGQRVLAVAGTHGKTTTTALLTVALLEAGADPTYAVGGILTATGRNADAGSGELFVAEADESDGAFLVYSPTGAIVTNVEADHLDVWGTEEAYHDAFERFLDRIGEYVVCCTDDPGAADLARVAGERGLEVISVGTSADADLRAVGVDLAGGTSGGTRFTVVDAAGRFGTAGGVLGEVSLRITGRHFALDALAALAVGLREGFGFEPFAAGLGAFTGSGRRMEVKGEVHGVRVVDSYAHHHTEIAGDIEAARAMAGEGRVLAVFQPHLVSRTRAFAAEMGRALGAADAVWVLDVYVAREDPDPDVSGALVADAVPGGAARFVADFAAVADETAAAARPGDVVLTLGAGDVTRLGPMVLTALAGAS